MYSLVRETSDERFQNLYYLHTFQITFSPKATVEWLAPLIYILEVSGSKFSLETGIPDWGSSRFPSENPDKCWSNIWREAALC